MPRLGWLLASALALPAHAVMLDASGRGQVLIYPYYTVNAGQQTLLSVVNHSADGKALKVRFHEARNGRTALSFNLYLGAYDVWTAALFALDAQAAPGLVTFDRSCTAPSISAGADLPTLPNGTAYTRFETRDFSGARADGGPSEPSRTREGYFEVIEMGRLRAGSAAARAAMSGGSVAPDCGFFSAAWQNGDWSVDSTRDLDPPGGQLSGAVSWIRVDEGAMNNAAATALDRFSVVVQHSAPDAATPNLASAVTETGGARVESTIIADGRLLRSFWPPERAIDAVSVVLMKDVLGNSVLQQSSVDSRSEWVLTLPTKRFYLDAQQPRSNPAPFQPASANSPPGAACITFTLDEIATYNTGQFRVEGYAGSGLPPPVAAQLCYATQTVSLSGQPGSIFGSQYRQQLDNGLIAPVGNGQRQIDLGGNRHVTLAALGGEIYRGLPVIGFHAYRYANGFAQPGLIGRYCGTSPHGGFVHCERAGVVCSSP